METFLYNSSTMSRRIITSLLLLSFVVSLGLQAQSTKSLRINEVLVINNNNYQDGYGQHSAWVEIFNSSFATVDLKGCFLTNDLNNPTMYAIPKMDFLTKIKPRQHALFWADGVPTKGTFHLSFTLDTLKSNFIALFDSNGKDLIDSVTIPAGQIANCSYGRIEDGTAQWEVKGIGSHGYVTPSTNNLTIDKNLKIDNFKKNDPDGFGMSITAMAVVFCGLLLLFLSFKFVGSISIMLTKRNAMKAQGITNKEEAKGKGLGTQSGEVYAAIAMALHEMQEDVHDIEETILTINKVKRNYSPWSSKIYNLRQAPRH